METPEQLQGGMKRLASYARRFGRDPGEIEVVYRTHRYQLEKGGAPPRSSRRPFHGSAESVASDIRRYEELGVSQLVVDFTRLSPTLDGVLGQMEEFATRVWPKV
jgi:hypothetical protein